MELFISLRPKQWVKNFTVFAGLIFSRNFFDLSLQFTIWIAFFSFCAAVSAGYLINDTIDRERDRLHPLKKNRPIASGKISPTQAVSMALVLLAVSLAGGYLVEPLISLFVGIYLVLQIAYTFVLKHLVIIDVLAIAAGFVLRAVAGAAIIHVAISPWLIVCTLLLALFLGLAKRRAELVLLEEEASSHRQTLDHYSLDLVDQMTSVTAAAVLVSYSLYTFTALESTWLMLTIPFVLYGIFRYLYLVHLHLRGGSPEQVLLTDKPLLVNVLLWGIAAVIILNFE